MNDPNIRLRLAWSTGCWAHLTDEIADLLSELAITEQIIRDYLVEECQPGSS